MSNGENKTEEELKAEEEAKKAAEEEAGKKVDETPPAGDKKDEGEDLAGKDVAKYSPKEMLNYIDKLKDENARRRIAHRDLNTKYTALEKELADKESRLSKLEENLSAVEEENRCFENKQPASKKSSKKRKGWKPESDSDWDHLIPR